MRMRRIFFIFVSSILLAATAFSGVALADDSFSFDGVTLSNIRLNPESLPGSGQVSATVDIAVDSSREAGGIRDVRIEGNGVSSNRIENISIGDNMDLNFTLYFADNSQLGTQLTLFAKWEGSGNGLPFTLTVPSSEPTEPQINFTRTIDKTSAEAGDRVTLTYTVKNAGSIDITDIVVTDEGIGAALSIAEPALAAGNSIDLPYSHVVNADFTSAPKLTYKAGGKSYTATCPAKAVALKVVRLDAELRAITPDVMKPDDEVMLICDLVNTGNVKLTNIVISEKTLGSNQFTAASLDKGLTMQFSRKVKLTQTTKFQYNIVAKDDAGRSYTTKTNELEVVVSSGNDQYNIDIMASPDAIQLAEPGMVRFEIRITNKGMDPVANASVIDQDGKVLKAFESLPAGDTKLPYEIVIDKTTSFNFTLLVPGSEGDYHRSTGTLEIKVTDSATPPAMTDDATPVQTSTDKETSQNSSGSQGSLSKISSMLTAMMVVGVLIIITIIVLIGMIISDKRKKRKK